MRTLRFSDSQIIGILKEAEARILAPCRTHSISSATFYKWRAKFGGIDVSLIFRMEGDGRREPATEEDVCRSTNVGQRLVMHDSSGMAGRFGCSMCGMISLGKDAAA